MSPSQSHKNYVLEAQNITMKFGGITAVGDLSMQIAQNSITGLIGPNGAGKTTAFNVLSGFYTPQEGRIIFNGEDIKNVAPHNICKKGMARTFQNIRLFHTLTSLENIMIGRHVRRKHSWLATVLSLPNTAKEEREIRQRAWELLERLNLTNYAHEKASSLPYGAQRRLEIARALATEPTFLMLDEPAAGMNPQESHDLLNFIKHIREEFDLTIFLIEHDMKVVMNVCEEIYVLEYGQLIAQGNPEEIQSNKRVIEAYLGEDAVL